MKMEIEFCQLSKRLLFLGLVGAIYHSKEAVACSAGCPAGALGPSWWLLRDDLGLHLAACVPALPLPRDLHSGASENTCPVFHMCIR